MSANKKGPKSCSYTTANPSAHPFPSPPLFISDTQVHHLLSKEEFAIQLPKYFFSSMHAATERLHHAVIARILLALLSKNEKRTALENTVLVISTRSLFASCPSEVTNPVNPRGLVSPRAKFTYAAVLEIPRTTTQLAIKVFTTAFL